MNSRNIAKRQDLKCTGLSTKAQGSRIVRRSAPWDTGCPVRHRLSKPSGIGAERGSWWAQPSLLQPSVVQRNREPLVNQRFVLARNLDVFSIGRHQQAVHEVFHFVA